MIRKSVAIGCLLFGIVLLHAGYVKNQSVLEGVTGTFLSGPWAYFVAGAVLFISGAGLLAGKKRK
jgi:LPXTG-motif cell wall-anchored protein